MINDNFSAIGGFNTTSGSDSTSVDYYVGDFPPYPYPYPATTYPVTYYYWNWPWVYPDSNSDLAETVKIQAQIIASLQKELAALKKQKKA